MRRALCCVLSGASLLFSSSLLGCGSGGVIPSGLAIVNPPGTSAATSPIRHVVIIMQENRSFDNLFNGFPGADTAQSGLMNNVLVPLKQSP